MPRDGVTGVYTRVSNSFSEPVGGTVIDEVDAEELFDDQDTEGFNILPALLLDGDLQIVNFDGGAGASSSTFWRGDGNWATPALATVNFTITPQGRITLASATPVMTASQAARTTVYYTPYCGNVVPIYDGTNFTAVPFSEVSQATTDTTKSPAAVANNSMYDLFVWNDAGTVRCTRGPLWTNDTTRSAGTALVMVNGIYLNNAAITNGPAASRGTYVGTIRSNGSAQIDFIFGAGSSGGTAAFFGVWNAYNRVVCGTTVTDSGAGYAYASSTIRQARASAGNQISFVFGLSEDAVWVSYNGRGSPDNTGAAKIEFGFGYDSTTVYGITPVYVRNVSTFSFTGGAGVSAPRVFAIGLHYVAALESNPWNTAGNEFFDQTSDNSLNAILRN